MEIQKLLGDNVIVEQEEEVTKSGIVLVKDIEMDDTSIGKVVAVGIGRTNDVGLVPINVKVGDKIMFRYGKKITFKGKTYLLITNTESDIVLIV